jgi:fatty acid CoA ligase FadD9
MVAMRSFAEQLKDKFGVEVPMETVVTSSIEELSRWMQATDAARAAGDVELAERDLHEWNWSTINAERISALARAVSSSAEDGPGSILLTGATGFLGIQVLYKLLHSTPDSNRSICCVVRAKTNDAVRSAQLQQDTSITR